MNKRERDTHERLRGTRPGRLSRADAVQQSVKLAIDEVELAMAAHDVKSARVHASIARRFLGEALAKLQERQP